MLLKRAGLRWRGCRALAAGAVGVGLLSTGLAAPGWAAETAADPAAANAQVAAASTLREAAATHGKYVGAAVAVSPLNNEQAYADILAREFSSVTAENAMKWAVTEPSRGQFDYSQADRIVAAAKANGQVIHGHTLVWHSQLPSWAENLPAGELRSAMLNHIENVAGRYSGDVRSWDVVNEIFLRDGSRRQSVFQRKLGDDYVATALRAANAADPDAKLYLNDYSIEGINAKSDAYYRLARNLLASGVPLDGIGFQAHLIVGQVPSDLQRNLQRFADLGLEVAITELDVRIPLPASSQELRQQAQDYRQVAEACLAVSACKTLTTWGITDKHTWIPDVFSGYGAPLPYDESYNPKPAYYALLEAFGGSPDDGTGDPGDGDGNQDPAGACSVDYRLQNEWNNGYVAQLVVRNNSDSTLSGWTLTFDNPGGQQVTHAWNAQVSQQGSRVTAVGSGWNGTIPAGGSVNFGFQGTLSSPHVAPSDFSLNGTSCS